MAIKKAQGIKRVIQSMAGLLSEPVVQARTKSGLYQTPLDIPALSTGMRPLDKALGVKGLPYGHIVELVAPGINFTKGGSTCIVARIAAKVQRQQEVVTLIDMNHGLDPWQAERCGLIAPQLLLTRPDTLFKALTAIEHAAYEARLIIVFMGLVDQLLQHVEPRLLSTLLRRLQNIVRSSDSAFVVVTHSSQDDPFHPQNYPPGFPLADVATVRLSIQEEGWTYQGVLATAYKANITVIKNQLGAAGTGADVRIKLSH